MTWRPSSRPRTRRPLWLSTVETGKCGISEYSIVSSTSMSRIKAPSPVPRTTPTSSLRSVRPRMLATASTIRCIRLSLTGPFISALSVIAVDEQRVRLQSPAVLVQERLQAVQERPLAGLQLFDLLLERRPAVLGFRHHPLRLHLRLALEELSLPGR